MRLFVLLAVGFFLFCCVSGTTSFTRPLAASCSTYTVQAGDICWDIAEANGISVADLEAWNPTADCSNLQIGEVLCVSDPGGTSPPSGSCTTYTVQAGDTCWDIAEANGITLSELQSWNSGIDCSNLQIGQVLCISDPTASPSPPPPPPSPTGSCVRYAVQQGDTCWTISQAYGISLADFESWNPGINCANLRVGQLVCVTEPGSTPPPPPPPPAAYNGDVFIEYIGAIYNGVQFSDVPINANVSFYFILAFAIDYDDTSLQPSNGIFNIHWKNSVLTADAVQAIKAQNSNVKVMVSIGGDTIQGQSVEFTPTTNESWVSNAVASLTSLIEEYHLDGIDINYEHFASSASPATFSTCIGQLITQLKESELISVTSIAPFDSINSYYLKLWEDYSDLIDYVNFQFYTYSAATTADEYVGLYEVAAASYGGGEKLLASFNTFSGIGPPPATVLEACGLLQSNGRLPGIFVWCADHSLSSSFVYDIQAQALLAGEEVQAEEAALYLVA